MAVILETPGLEVTVVDLHSQPLPEHNDDDNASSSEPCTSHKYIEAKSGATFSIKMRFANKFNPANRDIPYTITVDGRRMISRIISDMTLNGDVFFTSGVTDMENGVHVLRRFMFSQLDIVEGSSTQQADEKLVKYLASIGTITVRLWNGRKYGSPTPFAPNFDHTGCTDPGTISEKMLKGRAVSHSVSLQQGTKTNPILSQRADNIGDPIAVFHFKYRSRNALQALQIVPRSPSPVPLEQRDIEELTTDEMRELLRRRQQQTTATTPHEIKSERTRVKRERDIEDATNFDTSARPDDDDDECSFVEIRPIKRARADSGVVIDLDGSPKPSTRRVNNPSLTAPSRVRGNTVSGPTDTTNTTKPSTNYRPPSFDEDIEDTG